MASLRQPSMDSRRIQLGPGAGTAAHGIHGGSAPIGAGRQSFAASSSSSPTPAQATLSVAPDPKASRGSTSDASTGPPRYATKESQQQTGRVSLQTSHNAVVRSKRPLQAMLGVLRQTWSLVLTHVTVRWRNKTQSAVELSFPVAIVALQCVLFVLVRDYTSGTGGMELYDPFRPRPLRDAVHDWAVSELWFAADTATGHSAWHSGAAPLLRAAVERMRLAEGLEEGQIRWFDDRGVMETALCAPANASLRPFAAVSFTQVLDLATSCLQVGRRMLVSRWRERGRNFSGIGGMHYIIHRGGLPPPDYTFATTKPYFPAPTRIYAEGGLLALQHALDYALAEAITGVAAPRPAIQLRRYPPPNELRGLSHARTDAARALRLRARPRPLAGPSDDNATVDGGVEAQEIKAMKARDSVFRRGGGPVLAVAFIMLFATVAANSVRQREDGHANCFMVLGLSPAAHSASILISVALLHLPSCIAVTLLLLKTEALVGVNFVLLVVYLECYAISVAAAAQLFSVAFQSSEDTPMLSVVVYLTVVAAGVAIAECSEPSLEAQETCFISGELIASSLLSPVALVLGFQQIVTLINDEGRTVNWDNLSKGRITIAGGSDDFTVSVTLSMIVCDVFLYMIAAWYLTRVLYSGHSPLFFADCSYWCPASTRTSEAVPLLPDSIDHEPPEDDWEQDAVLAVRDLTAYVPLQPGETTPGGFLCRPARRAVLDHFGLDINQGQVLALVGPDGKSTFLRIITGQVSPYGGRFFVGGQEVFPSQGRMRVGFCPQRGVFFDELTVHEHLVLFSVIRGVPRLKVKAEAERWSKEVDLINQRDRFVSTLTAGQKRKLAVALAFIGSPDFVFLDEPMNHMDLVSAQHIREMIHRRKRDCAIVICTSSMEEADALADRIAVVLRGKLRCIGTALFLKRRFGCGYLITIKKLRCASQAADERLRKHMRTLSKSACMRESRGELRVHIPTTAVEEVIKVLECLHDPRERERLHCRRWNLQMNGLEDVYLRLLEENDVPVYCPEGHPLVLHTAAVPVPGGAGTWTCHLWGKGCRNPGNYHTAGRWSCAVCHYDLCELCWAERAERSEWTLVDGADLSQQGAPHRGPHSPSPQVPMVSPPGLAPLKLTLPPLAVESPPSAGRAAAYSRAIQSPAPADADGSPAVRSAPPVHSAFYEQDPLGDQLEDGLVRSPSSGPIISAAIADQASLGPQGSVRSPDGSPDSLPTIGTPAPGFDQAANHTNAGYSALSIPLSQRRGVRLRLPPDGSGPQTPGRTPATLPAMGAAVAAAKSATPVNVPNPEPLPDLRKDDSFARLPVGMLKLSQLGDAAPAAHSPTECHEGSPWKRPFGTSRREQAEVGMLPPVLFTPASRRSVARQLAVLVLLKRWKMFRYNTRAALLHIALPLGFVVMGMLVLRLLPNAARMRPALHLEADLVSNAEISHPDGPASVTIFLAGSASNGTVMLPPPCRDCGAWVAFRPIGRAIAEANLPSWTPLSTALTPQSGLPSSGATVSANSTARTITLWFNATSLHGIPSAWNLFFNAIVLHDCGPASAGCARGGPLAELFDNRTVRVFTSVHAYPEEYTIENAMPVLSFGVVTAIGMAFLSSGFAATVVNERVRGGRLLQQTAGVAPLVYWLSHYLSDSVVTVVITVCVSTIMVALDPILHGLGSFSALFVVLLLYMQASLVITYLVSHLFASAWKAQSGIAAGFLCVMTVPLVLSVSITSSGGTFLRNFSGLTVFIFNPLYSLVNALFLLTDFMATESSHARADGAAAHFDLIQQPLIGLSVQFGGGILLLALYETRIPLKKWIKQKIPRPAGFYDDPSGTGRRAQQEEAEMEEDVLVEKREVERLAGQTDGFTTVSPEFLNDIVVHELRKSYRARHEDSYQVHHGKLIALRSLNLRVRAGEVFGLLGPAGAGKTTTTLMLSGALTPSQGEAFIDGHSILTNLAAARLRMGVCLQHDAMVPELTVDEHIHLYATLRGLEQSTIAKLADESLDRLGLRDHRGTRVRELSAGLSRRLALLLAFVGRPSMLILDEPTAGMDLLGRKRAWAFLLAWIKRMHQVSEQEGRAKPIVFLCSQMIEEVHLLCTRIGILVKGRLRCLGKARVLRERFGSGWALGVRTVDERHAHQFTDWLHKHIPGARHTSGIIGGHLTFYLPADVSPPEVFRLLEQEKAALCVEDYSVTQLSLEEVFRRAVRGSRHDAVFKDIPSLQIVILIVGTRGDVQPFVALAQGLLRDGHAVRIATHHKFKKFVEQYGVVEGSKYGRVEFFGIGGDPDFLMSFMVENPDMVTINAAKIRANKEMMMDIFRTCWQACTLAGGEQLPGEMSYVPDVIIANPPVQCHCHIAEKLQCHLQVHFTMPWSPTSTYAHPLAPTDAFGVRESYAMVEQMMWLGLGGKLNEFRSRHLGLDRITRGAGLPHRLQIPHVYCMSESLLERPTDWGPHISMAGFWFLDCGTGGGPDEIKRFCEAGQRPPIYIGFGSIVTPDRGDVATLTKNIYEALRRCAERDAQQGKEPLRAIVQCCEGGFFHGEEPPKSVDVLVWRTGVPHDWLFPMCSAVCHHGGAGTLSAGLRAGKPTVVVSFFGDQPFWGKIVAYNKLGASVPIRDALRDVRLLESAFSTCQEPHVQRRAAEMGTRLQQEDGVLKGIKAFYSHLPLHNDGERVTFVCECYENQRFYPLIGWSDTLLPSDRYPWSDKTGRARRHRHGFVLPDGWSWCTEWEVDLNAWPSEGSGFQYAVDWRFEFHPRHGPMDMVRRRRWIRRREYLGGEDLRPPTALHARRRQSLPIPFVVRSPGTQRDLDRLEKEVRELRARLQKTEEDLQRKDQVIARLAAANSPDTDVTTPAGLEAYRMVSGPIEQQPESSVQQPRLSFASRFPPGATAARCRRKSGVGDSTDDPDSSSVTGTDPSPADAAPAGRASPGLPPRQPTDTTHEPHLQFESARSVTTPSARGSIPSPLTPGITH